MREREVGVKAKQLLLQRKMVELDTRFEAQMAPRVATTLLPTSSSCHNKQQPLRVFAPGVHCPTLFVPHVIHVHHLPFHCSTPGRDIIIMPVDVHCLADGWLELESDPGLFTLLVEDFGCQGVQVEEIYDLQKPNIADGPVFGFIFLFKWIEERRSRNRYNSSGPGYSSSKNSDGGNKTPAFVEDDQTLHSLFFAHQIIPNSCATHALISILLNSDNVDLGPVLSRLKQETRGMSPENKGLAIGNAPELAAAHNSHACIYDMPDCGNEKMPAATTARSLANQVRVTADSFHYVSYVPIRGRLYELDGLKKFPVDHGPIPVGEDWTEMFRRVISQRLAQESNAGSSDSISPDIRYNLMAVVPDKRVTLTNRLNNLKSNRHIVLEALEKMMRPMRLPEPLDYHNYSRYPPEAEYREPPPSPKVDKHVTPDKQKASVRREGLAVSATSRSGDQQEFEKPLTVDTSSGHVLGMAHSKAIYTSTATSLTSPLTIQTTSGGCSVSPALSSCSSATDTCSEASSAFNSPIPRHSSVVINPNERVTKFFVCKVVPKSPASSGPDGLSPNKLSPAAPLTPTRGKAAAALTKQYCPKDMISLLKALEGEISACDSSLKDELEKRKRYRIDDSRRSHNYDDFITTFILMLTQQGKLPDLLGKALNSSSTTASSVVYDVPVESPQSPSTAFFAELHASFGDLKAGISSGEKTSISAVAAPDDTNGGAACNSLSEFSSFPASSQQQVRGVDPGERRSEGNSAQASTGTILKKERKHVNSSSIGGGCSNNGNAVRSGNSTSVNGGSGRQQANPNDSTNEGRGKRKVGQTGRSSRYRRRIRLT